MREVWMWTPSGLAALVWTTTIPKGRESSPPVLTIEMVEAAAEEYLTALIQKIGADEAAAIVREEAPEVVVPPDLPADEMAALLIGMTRVPVPEDELGRPMTVEPEMAPESPRADLRQWVAAAMAREP
jgi:hypothetical protein